MPLPDIVNYLMLSVYIIGFPALPILKWEGGTFQLVALSLNILDAGCKRDLEVGEFFFYYPSGSILFKGESAERRRG
jgi:hypothetical protein